MIMGKREPTNQNSSPITKTTTTITEFQRNDKAKKYIWRMTKGVQDKLTARIAASTKKKTPFDKNEKKENIAIFLLIVKHKEKREKKSPYI